VILTNKFPRLADASGALVGRLVILRLKQSFFGREDKALADRLLLELPGILNWALEGLADLGRCGRFIEPASSAQMIRAFEAQASPIGTFIEECCVLCPEERVARDELFVAWETWCLKNHHNPGSSSLFGADLRTAVPTLHDEHPRAEPGQRRPRYYVGIGLKR
jgi:putative DNA primase/helicase